MPSSSSSGAPVAPQPSSSSSHASDIPWKPVENLHNIKGLWMAKDGSTAHFRERGEAKDSHEKHGSPYPWKVTVNLEEYKRPLECGFYSGAQADPKGGGMWRVSYCLGASLLDGRGRHALRMVLNRYKGRLSVQVGSLYYKEFDRREAR